MNTKFLCLFVSAITFQAGASAKGFPASIAPTDTAYTISTDRPSVGASAFLVPSGVLQYEGGYQFSLNRQNQPFTDIIQNHSLDELLRFGISPRFELRLNVRGALQRVDETAVVTMPYWESGVYPVTGGFKYAVLTEKAHRPQVSWMSHYSIPWVAAGDFLVPSGNLVLHEQRLLVGKSLGASNSVSANIGFTGGLQGSASFVSDVLTTASFTHTHGNVSGYLEYFGTATWGGNRWYTTQNIDGGLTATVADGKWQLDAYMGWDISPFVQENATTSGLFFGVGASFCLPVAQMRYMR